MWPVLSKVFVRQFYASQAGFFLFFFFVFFGAVEGSQLLVYHLSLMNSILGSAMVLALVVFCWTLYHLKCTGFFLQVLNRDDGKFLHALQALPAIKLWFLCAALYTSLYAPVLLYGLVLTGVGLKKGAFLSAAGILLYHLISLVVFTGVLQQRVTHWHKRFYVFAWQLRWKKSLLLCIFQHFVSERKNLLLLLKSFSLALLSALLVWNRGRYDNDSFLLFYLVLLLAHAALPYQAVQFIEHRFPAYRNLPVPTVRRALLFGCCYGLLLLPDAVYLLWFATALPLSDRVAYCLNLPVSLFLLTAIQYSEAQSREEYLKACFALFFLSIFVLHVQVFWWWMGLQLVMSVVLFTYGYYRFEKEID